MTAARRPRRFICRIPARALRYGDVITSGCLAGYMVSGPTVDLSASGGVLVPLPGNMRPTVLPMEQETTVHRLLDQGQQIAQLVAERDVLTEEINRLAARWAAA